jgi:hypothetical protein
MEPVPNRAKPIFTNPLDALRYHVSGAVERGEKKPIVEIPAKPAAKRKGKK